jgi:hypothetical protein
MLLITTLVSAEPEILAQHRNEYALLHKTSGLQSYYIDIVLVLIGIMIVLIEICIWRRERKDKMMVSFSVFKN